MEILDQKFKKSLKQASHHLEPVVIIGQKGLTESVLKEINVNLVAHELIKIKINHDDREQRNILAQQISDNLDAVLVQNIGKISVLWRENPDKKD
ncbi:ribosome assembly RNA-binding protein YhbY [Neisseriaceae bacterium PsAf]|nr:ribosome assembly RNA-binding protein YhbY [Neisseriaceae bacterium PsAf]